jgi:hypothetical protein
MFSPRGLLLNVFFRLLLHFFLDFHVAELVRVEYLATIQAFYVFDVLFACYHAYFGVLAGGVHLGGLSVQPVLLGKIVPTGFRLSNLFLALSAPARKISSKSGSGKLEGCFWIGRL